MKVRQTLSFLFVTLLLLVQTLAWAQQTRTVKGQVLDQDGLPLIGAGVLAEGVQSVGVITDLEGNFTIEVPASVSSLRFSYIGMADVVEEIAGRDYIRVVMVADDLTLDGVVVTALGIKRSERAVSYIVQTIGSEAFAARDANFVNSLAGRLAGVQVNASSAGIGGETKVVMRGAKSIAGNNNALYVLDGIPLPALSLTNPGDKYDIYSGSALTGDVIPNFNSDDIADMSALVGVEIRDAVA